MSTSDINKGWKYRGHAEKGWAGKLCPFYTDSRIYMPESTAIYLPDKLTGSFNAFGCSFQVMLNQPGIHYHADY
jgi:hypothetical protein